MNVPGLPNLPAPSPNMWDNYMHTGNYRDNDWRHGMYQPPRIEPIEPISIRPITSIFPSRDDSDDDRYPGLSHAKLW